jgi:hypothetical protein
MRLTKLLEQTQELLYGTFLDTPIRLGEGEMHARALLLTRPVVSCQGRPISSPPTHGV